MSSAHCNHRRALLAAALLVPVLACNEDTQQPSAPEEVPQLSAEAAVAAAVASNTWLVRADLPSTERYLPAVATVKNASGQSIVYVIGGKASGPISKVQAYNASTDTRSYKASLPVPLAFSNGAVTIGNKIYISGGLPNAHEYFASLYVYDPATNRWSRKADMPNTGVRGVSGAIGGKLYVLTYCQDPDRCSADIFPGFYRYDPASDRWTTLRGTRDDGSNVYHPGGMGGVISGKLYAVGGYLIDQLDVYDPATNHWKSLTPMNSPRSDAAGVAVGGKLYVIGGLRGMFEDNQEVVRTNSVYDPATNTWTNKRGMPSPRTGMGGSVVMVGGQARIEVVGGGRPGNNLQYVP